MTTRMLALRLYRRLVPSARTQDGFRHSRNSGSRKQRQCVFCGATCPGWSGNWGRTKVSIRWERGHDCSESWLRSKLGDRYDAAIALWREACLAMHAPVALLPLDDLLREVPS